MQFKNEVIFTGTIIDEELSKVLASADVAVYPSTFEGFGLPVIEAFACGVPIMTSKNTAMEEIAKGAAHLFNPLDDNELKNLLFNLITHPYQAEEKIKQILYSNGESLIKYIEFVNFNKNIPENHLFCTFQKIFDFLKASLN